MEFAVNGSCLTFLERDHESRRKNAESTTQAAPPDPQSSPPFDFWPDTERLGPSKV
jgi:hypothetical protein